MAGLFLFMVLSVRLPVKSVAGSLVMILAAVELPFAGAVVSDAPPQPV